MNGKKKVAFFGDTDNLHASLVDEGRKLDPKEIIKTLLGLGEVVLAFAKMYAHWGTKSEQVKRDLVVAGFELIEAPLVDVGGDTPKPSTDQEMMRGIDQLVDHSDVDIFVIGTGDRDFLRVMQKARFAGKEVVLLCTPYRTSADLKTFADQIVNISGAEFKSPEAYRRDQQDRRNGRRAAEEDPTITWPEDNIAEDCRALFSRNTTECITDLLAVLPERLAVVIESSLICAIEIICSQETKGQCTTLTHIRNLIARTKPPLEKPKWAVGVHEHVIMNVLVEMSKADILRGVEVQEQWKPQPTTTYTVNWEHPFTQWVASRHPGIRAELAVQEPNKTIIKKIIPELLDADKPKNEMLNLIEPTVNEPLDTPLTAEEAAMKAQIKRDSQQPQHGETHNPPDAVPTDGRPIGKPEGIDPAVRSEIEEEQRRAALHGVGGTGEALPEDVEHPAADEPDAPGRLAHEMDEGPTQHGETHNYPDAVPVDGRTTVDDEPGMPGPCCPNGDPRKWEPRILIQIAESGALGLSGGMWYDIANDLIAIPRLDLLRIIKPLSAKLDGRPVESTMEKDELFRVLYELVESGRIEAEGMKPNGGNSEDDGDEISPFDCER